jgi:hypothetical protein
MEGAAGEAGIALNMLSLIERGEGDPTWLHGQGDRGGARRAGGGAGEAAEGLEG